MIRHRIEDFNLTNIMLNSDNKNRSQLTFNNDIIPKARTSNRSVSFKSIIYNESTAEELRELLNNKSFHILDFSSGIENIGGLYSLISGSVDQKGGQPYYTMNIKAEGKFTKYKWIIDAEEITTDWDTIATEPFTEGGADNDFNEGNEATLDSGYTWRAVDGDWRVDGADDYLKCDVDSGNSNTCVFVAKAIATGYYPPIADVEVQAEITLNSINNELGLSIRNQNISATANGHGYVFSMNEFADECYFIRNTGASTTTLKTWIDHGIDFAYGTTYTIKVIAQGNRFDCYIDDNDGNLTFIGTVFDDYYKTGYHGLHAITNVGHFDDFSLSHAKPIVVRPYVGAYDYNQIRMPVTTRLNDDIHADGLSRTIIAPDNPIEFQQWENQLNDPSIVLDLPLNEGMGTTVYDNSGNDNDGTISGSAIWRHEYINNKIQSVLGFEADDSQFITVTDDDSLSFENDHPFTIEIQIKLNSIGVINGLIDKYNAGVADREYIFWITASNYIEFMLFDGVLNAYGSRISARGNTTVTTDTYYHIVVTYDGSKDYSGIQIYINGTAETMTDTSAGVYNGMDNGTADFRIGNIAANHLDGIGRGVCIRRRELTAIEVQQQYDQLSLNSPSGGSVKVWDTMGEDGLWDYLEFHAKLDEATGTQVYDSSKHNRAVTENSWATADWSVSSYCKHAKTTYHFDGNNDYFSAALDGEDIDSHGWTIGGWFKCDGAGTTENFITLYDTTAPAPAFRISRWPSDVIYVFVYGTVTSGIWYSTDTIADTNWHFIVATWDGNISNDPILYLDGESITLTETASPDGVYDADTCDVGSANHAANANNLDGYADDAFCFSTVLSADRIKWLYENMPRMVIEEGYKDIQGWREVRDPDHHFVGDMIVDNGLIRLSYKYRDRNGTAYSNNSVMVTAYSDGIWEEPEIFINYYAGAYLDFGERPVIKSLEKHKVVLSQYIYDASDPSLWLRQELYITHNPFMNIKIIDWNLSADLYTQLITWNGRNIEDGSYSRNPRFATASLDSICDADVDAGVSGGETEGINLAFSTQTNLIYMYWDQDNSNWHVWNQVAGEPIAMMRNLNAINFDADTPPHWFACGLLPFDTDLLQVVGTDDSIWTGEDGIGADAGSFTDTFGNCVFINNGTMTADAVTYSGGSYRAFVLWSSATGAGSGTFTCTGASSVIPVTNATIANNGEWDIIDFIADSPTDNITFSVTENNIENIYVGEIIIIPISNSKSFPLDVRNHALSIEHIMESCF